MRARALQTAAAVGLLLSACAPTPAPVETPTPTSTPSGPIVVGALTMPAEYDPTNTTDPYVTRIAGLLQRGVYRYDAKGKAVPEVAESVTSTDDRVFTVTLAEGWRFSDGEPVTSDSFVDAWSRAADPARPTMRRGLFAPIDGFVPSAGAPPPTSATPGADGRSPRLRGLTVLDSRTFRITLGHPDPTFRQRLGHVAFAPLPDVAFTAPETYRRRPVGNGPYALDGDWSGTGPVRLRPDPTYTATDPARNAGLDFRVYTDTAAALRDVEAGRLDILDALPVAALGEYRDTYAERAVNQPMGTVLDIVFPTDDAPWNGPSGRGRRTAVSMAVDREALARDAYAGTAAPATDLSTPVVEGHTRDLCGAACRLDPETALETLTEAGGMPAPMTLAYAADTGQALTAQAVCADITEHLEITCTPRPHATTESLLAAVRTGRETGPYLSRYRMDYPLLENFLLPRFTPGLPTNSSGYAAPAARAALERAARTVDEDRIPRFQTAEALILRDMPVVPLLDLNATAVSSTAVTNVRVDVFGAPDYVAVRRP